MKLGLAILLMTITCSASVYSQPGKNPVSDEEVRRIVAEFNKAVFCSMEPSRALQEFFFLGNADETDSRFGLQGYYAEITKKEKPQNRFKHFVTNLYFNMSLAFVQIKLGQQEIVDDKSLIDGELAVDKDIRKTWNQVLVEIGVTKELLEDDEDSLSVDLYFDSLEKLNAGIKKRTSQSTILRNLKFINEKTTVKKEVFEGRDYYRLENQIFCYTVALKDGILKIVYINRSNRGTGN